MFLKPFHTISYDAVLTNRKKTPAGLGTDEVDRGLQLALVDITRVPYPSEIMSEKNDYSCCFLR